MNTNNTTIFNKFFIGTLKRKAQIIYPIQAKLDKALKAKAEAEALIEELQEQINDENKSTLKKTGYNVMDLVKRVITPTGKYDKNNQEIKQTTWELIYPDTVVPDNVEADNREGVSCSGKNVDEQSYVEQKAEERSAYEESEEYQENNAEDSEITNINE